MTTYLTSTLLAQHFRFGCDRRLLWGMLPAGAREGVVPAAAEAPGLALLAAAGRRFERRAVAALLRRHGDAGVRIAHVPGTGTPASLPTPGVVAALREPGALRWIVQPELRLADPDAFAARFGIPRDVRIAPGRPDLLRVGRDRRGRTVVGVGDVKWSREATVQHHAQVAYYSFLLEALVREAGIDARVLSRHGWIWTRGARAPRRFDLGAYRHHVAAFLREELPRIVATLPERAEWHVLPGCAACAHLPHCRAQAEAEDHLSRVVGLSPLAASTLRTRGIETVGALRRAEFRRDTYTGCEALEGPAPVLKKRVQALDYGKVKEGERRTLRAAGAGARGIAVAAEGDPVTGRAFALGLRAVGADGRARAEVFLAERGTAEGERVLLATFLERLVAVAGEDGGGFHLHLWERGEAELLREALQRQLGARGGDAALAAAARLLFPRGTAAPPPATLVADLVAERFALPLPHAWTLDAVSALLRPADGGWVHRPRPELVRPLGSALAFERVHEVWRGAPGAEALREEIVRTVESKLAAVDSVVRAVREAAARRAQGDRGSEPAPTGSPHPPLAHPLLERLRLFTLAEAAAEAASVRALHALPTAERARRFECISGMERVEVLPNGHAVFTFDEACREAKFRPGDFALVLTNDDDGRTLAEADARGWLRRRLMVELVEYDLAAVPPRLTLASERGWDRLEADRLEGRPLLDPARVAVLDRALVDFNTARVVATLAALDAGAGEAAAVLSLLEGRVPDGWPSPLDPGPAEALLASAGAPLGPDQREAWRAPFERAATVVWGPPGTGKTYLLAWILLGLAASARAAGRPLRIAVTAVTHRAVANVLARLSAEAGRVEGEPPLRALKLAGRGSEADGELEGGLAEVVPDSTLGPLLERAEREGVPVVVGSTVWSLWKGMRDLARDAATEEEAEHPLRPLFDVVVIDEASQMKVPEALVALSALRAGGRVVLAGDDRQLPPIVHGRYPPEETALGSAFTHFAAKFGRVMLRRTRRMNRALVRWPATLFYPGFVSLDPGRRLPRAEVALPADPLDAALLDAFLRPEEGAVLCTYDGYRAGARNALEAELVARIVRLARCATLDPAEGAPWTDDAFRARGAAVIAPHRAQAAAVLGALAREGWARDSLPVVDTVERMQGNERELIVVSYGVADPEHAEREAGFLLDPNRFNVSITRARAKLVVFLPDAVLRARPTEEEVMTASTAVQGYPAHLGPPVRTVEVPAPGGGTVLLTLRAARVGADG